MLLGIQHRTELTYGDRVSESVMELRVMPRSDKNQTLRAFNLKVGPEAVRANFERYGLWSVRRLPSFRTATGWTTRRTTSRSSVSTIAW